MGHIVIVGVLPCGRMVFQVDLLLMSFAWLWRGLPDRISFPMPALECETLVLCIEVVSGRKERKELRK